MTRKHKPRKLRVVLWFPLMVTLIQFSSGAFASGRKDRFWETVDVSQMVELAQEGTGMPAEVCEELVRRNLKHIYFNALDHDQFIASPSPGRVAKRIEKVFTLARDLRLLVAEARIRAVSDEQRPNLLETIKKIEKVSSSLHETFRGFFLEDQLAQFERNNSPVVGAKGDFELYLDGCEEILQLLDHEIQRYFLNPSPDIINLSAYRKCSVASLSRALQQLSESFRKSYPQ